MRDEGEGALAGAGEESLRIDRWLWRARFLRSRTAAAKLVVAGRVRVNRVRIGKANHPVKAGDVLTFPQEGRIRVVRVRDTGFRRGPAAEARALYEDLSPPEPMGRRAEPSPRSRP